MIAVGGILASLLLLMYLAYRNHSVIVIAPLCALVAVGFDGELPLLATYTQIFMENLGKFIVRYFALFLLGAIFGKLMEETGSAATIAMWVLRWVGTSRVLLAVVLTCAVLNKLTCRHDSFPPRLRWGHLLSR
jgi:H+/gluconate symporter-like permease